MKTITSIKQLRAEKKRLGLRKAELEKAITHDWRDLKESLRPKNVASQALSKIFDSSENKNVRSHLSDTVSELTANFAIKLVEKLEEKITKWLKN